MISTSHSPSMPVMQISSPSFSTLSDLNTNNLSSPDSETEEEYHYEPLATASDVYDTEIDNISDLDPHDPAAIRDFITRMGPSDFASPAMSGGAEYDGDDEDSETDIEGLGFNDANDARGLSPIAEKKIEAEGKDHEMTQWEFMRYLSEEWTLVAEADSDDSEARHPSPARRFAFSFPYSNILFSENFSYQSPHSTARNSSLERQASDNEASKLQLQSLASTPGLPPIQGTAEYFNHFARQPHYHQAAEFFAVDINTGEFANPFTAPRDSRGRPASLPSPLTRPNDYGLIETWNFQARKVQSISPVSSLSNCSQSADDGQSISPISNYPLRHGNRESSIPRQGISNTPPHAFPPLSPASSSPSDSKLFSASELNAQLDDLLLDNAAYEFFSTLDIEGLVADQASNSYVLEDHDTLHDPWEVEHEWPYRMWLPHEPKRSCHCWWCIEYWMPSDDDDMYRTHDFDRRCYCPVCESFRCEEMVREMEKREMEERMEKKGATKHKRQKSASRKLFDEHETRNHLQREIWKLKRTWASKEDEEAEEVRSLGQEGERGFVDRRIFHIQESDEAQSDKETKGEKENKKCCLGLFDWIKRQLREEAD